MNAAENGLIEIKSCAEAGYHPQIRFGSWRVAFLNDTDRFHRENISELQRHNTSDETFILLKGSCSLVVGDGADSSAGKIIEIPLEPLTMYNIRRGVWHTHILGPDASVAVVENDDVSPENTDRLPFRFA